MDLWSEFKGKLLAAIEVLRESGHDMVADLLEEEIEASDGEQGKRE